MGELPNRKTYRLRFGRISSPGASYFVTECAKHRLQPFRNPMVAARARDALGSIHLANDAEILAATLMPDHAHLLFTLGERLELGQVLAKFKALARRVDSGWWNWQDDGFEHRLREGDLFEDYAFYIFMNPYRAQLLAMNQVWPWWFCPDESRFLFLQGRNPDGTPPHEWLDLAEKISGRMAR